MSEATEVREQEQLPAAQPARSVDWRRGSVAIREAAVLAVRASARPSSDARTHADGRDATQVDGLDVSQATQHVPAPPLVVPSDELIDQLGQPHSLAAIIEAGITPGLVRDILGKSSDVDIAVAILEYVYGHLERNGTLPSTGVISAETGFSQFDLPSYETAEFLHSWKKRETVVRAKRVIKDAVRKLHERPEEAMQDLYELKLDLDRRTRAQQDGVVLTPMAHIEYQPIRWLWEGYIATRSVTILSGEPGVNKSTLAFGIAAGVTYGKSGDPGAALILTTEDSYQLTVLPRLQAAGADLSKVFALEKRRNGLVGHLQFPDDLHDLYQAVREHEARLVVIDPLTGHLTGNIDSWKEQSIRRVMSELYHIADETDCAILAIAHLNKNSTGNALTRVGGSMGITAASRSVLLMAKNPLDPDQRVLTSTKLNIGQEPPGLIYELEQVELQTPTGPVQSMRLARVGTTSMSSDEVLRPDKPTAAERAEDLLYEILSEDGDPVRKEDIETRAAEAGLKWRVVQEARTRIGRIVTDRDQDGATTWRLTSGERPE